MPLRLQVFTQFQYFSHDNDRCLQSATYLGVCWVFCSGIWEPDIHVGDSQEMVRMCRHFHSDVVVFVGSGRLTLWGVG